uniref:HTH arsR-type domain-containing protein n=1 Tax=Arundo donax TaxID=35708 RepID=A0A0A9EEA2_ARUDO
MLIAALSRDILEDFLPFLGRHANAILALLNDGGDRDPEILEQVFTSWSYIMMYLQKYLVKDVVQILRVTAMLRYFPKDHVREFMAESVSFLLRNAPSNQLTHGLMKVLLEAVKKSSLIRIDGVTALLWHVIKGTSAKLHSRAGKVLKFLLSKSIFTTIHDKFPDGSSTIHEVMTGLIQRLCDEVDLKELPLLYTCLFEEINSCFKDGCLDHLKCLIDILTFALQNKQSDVFDKVKILKLVELLVSRYVLPGSNIVGASSSKVLESILGFLLCVLDIPDISGNLSIVSPFYAPVFKLINSSVIIFTKKLLAKGPQIIRHFESLILSAMDNFLESSPEEVVFILLNFFKGSKKQIILHSTDGNHLDPGEKVCKFFESKFSFWIELLDDTVKRSSNQVSEKEAAILWASIRCYPNMNGVHKDSLSLLKKLICNLDRLLEVDEENMNGLPKTTWRSLLGAALSSYHELLLVNTNRNSELSLFVSLAKRHSTCPHVLSAVAEYLDFLQGVASMEVTREFDPQNLSDLFSIFSVNLSSPNKDVRILTLRILSYFVKMDQCLGTNEERPHKRQRTEDSGEETVTKYTNVVDTLLAVELTPISVSTSRKIAILISRVQMSLSSKMVLDDYIPPLLHGIIGILYNRFSDLWPPTLDCLAVLVRKHKELVWSQFVQFIAIHQSKGLTQKNQEKLEAAAQPQSIFDCFSLYLAMDFDCTPVETVATLLLQSLQRIPDVAESRSRHLVPLFLNFMGYDDGGFISADSYMSDKCKGKQWKMVLKEWLNMLRLMHNARSLYQSKILQEVLTTRVLDDSDPDIQAKALDCLLNWKDEFLTPYSQNLKNLIDVKTLREELTTWSVSRDSLSIQKDHRSCVVPLVIRVLTPKVRKLKLLGSRKHTGVSHRKAILRFLLQFDSNELELFFSLLLKSLVPGSLQLKMFSYQSDNLLTNISDIVGASAEICIENFTWKKANGFLHLVEEMFGTFDMAHIRPFLNGLLMIVARLLESCMQNLRSESDEKYPCNQSNDLDNDCSMNLEVVNSTNVKECQKEMPIVDRMEAIASIKQLKDLRSLCIRIVSSALSHYDSHDFGENFWNTFFSSVKPLIDCFTQEASSSEKPSSLFSCFMAMSRSPTLAPLLGTNNLVPAIFSILTVKTASGSITSCAFEFIENLLRLDIDLEQQDDHSVKKILVPHMDVLLHSLHDFVNYRKELHRRSGTWLGQCELRLFKLLLNYITDASVAEHVIDFTLPFFSKKDLNSDECLEALRVVRGIISNLRCGVSLKILNALNPLLATVGLELQLCICDIYDGLSLHESSMSSLARLIRDLNAVSTSELGEVDYDTRLRACLVELL